MSNLAELDKKIKDLSEKIDGLQSQLFELEKQRVTLMNESLDLKSYVGKYYKNIETPVTYYKIDDIDYYGDFFNNVKMTGVMMGFDPYAYVVYEESLAIRKEMLTEISKKEFMEKFDKIVEMATKDVNG